MRRARLAVLAFLGIGIALVACRAFDDVPARTRICEADDITGGNPLIPQATTCTECLENTPCCDQVGRCADDLVCRLRASFLFTCVLMEGTHKAAERETTQCLRSEDEGTPARAVYDCARANCGTQCSLPVCKLEPTVPFIANIECDRCFSLSCCNEFNACEKNRFCKLALDCIVNTCASELERTLSRDVAQASQETEAFACDPDGGVGLPPAQQDPNPTCTAQCLDKFIRRGEPTPEVKEAACLALRVQSCGAAANCGPKCRVLPVDPGDGGGDAQ